MITFFLTSLKLKHGSAVIACHCLALCQMGCLEDQVNSEVSWNQLRVYLSLVPVL